MVSADKSADNLIENSLYVTSLISSAFKILSSSLAFDSFIIICLGVINFVFILLIFY